MGVERLRLNAPCHSISVMLCMQGIDDHGTQRLGYSGGVSSRVVGGRVEYGRVEGPQCAKQWRPG